MATKNYQQKEKNVNDWVDIINYYWHKLESNLYNDKEFWDNTMHSMDTQDWWDFYEVYDIVRQQYPEEFHRFPKMSTDMNWVYKQLMLGKPVIKPMAKNYNTTGFRSWMVMKDVINNVRGTPTVDYKNNPPKPDEPETPFERLFDID